MMTAVNNEADENTDKYEEIKMFITVEVIFKTKFMSKCIPTW